MDVFANPAVALTAYFAAGIVTGVMAGLLGLGGGLVMIPVLNALFRLRGVPDGLIQHLALGTSLAAIVPTGLLSARGHAARGVVDGPSVRIMAPWIAAGALTSAVAAKGFSSALLQGFYVVLCGWVLYSLFLPEGVPGATPKPLVRPRPTAAVIGVLSGLLGIGGGSLTTPYLVRHGFDIRAAVGTAAALGVPLAAAGAAGYLIAGASVPGRPAWVFGFIDPQAVVGLACGSLISTRWGVALAHRWPRPVLRKAFAAAVLLAGAKMCWSVVRTWL